MLQGISIASLLATLAGFWVLIFKIVLLYIVLRVGSELIVWVCRTIFIPLVEKRAYFYTYNSEGVFYNERKILGFFRFGRNYRSRINDTLVGYIATKRGKKNENPGSNKIYLRKKGREFVGEAKCKFERNGTWVDYTNNQGEKVCNIFLTNPIDEGGYEIDENRPVGYVDNKGRVYKYYACREDWIVDRKLRVPEFIGQCETPSAKKGERHNTEGERSDADVLQYIEWEANESNYYRSENDSNNENVSDGSKMCVIDERRTYLDKNQTFQMDDRWLFFRRNRPRIKKVVSREMISGGAVPDGARFPYAFLSGKLWRILQVYPTGWPCKAKAWGYGYCTEGFRNPFAKNVEDFPMITRAAAALLLARKEGFYRDADEVVSDGIPGAAATAILSLFIYILLYPLLTIVSSYQLFPFLGKEYSSVTTLVGYYFIIWLCIVNPIRCIIRHNHEWLEAFLELLNRNVGVLGWISAIVVSLIIGLIGSIFMEGMDYIFFPLFLSAIIAVFVNGAYYHQQPWAVSSVFEDFVPEELEDEEENEQVGDEKIKHNAQLELPTKRVIFDETIGFDSGKLKELRRSNPFRIGDYGSYEETVRKMIEKEFGEEVYSKIKYLKTRISSCVNKYHLSNVEKVKLILRVCQPENIVYHYDWDSEELLPQSDEPAPNPSLIKARDDGKDGFGYREYCRYPTETIHDKRGDCDCHAAFGAALLAACGFRSCFVTGDVGSASEPAYHAMCGIECTNELKVFQRPDNSFEKDGRTYIILEMVGKYNLDEVMEYQKKMAEEMTENDTAVVIEPYNK